MSPTLRDEIDSAIDGVRAKIEEIVNSATSAIKGTHGAELRKSAFDAFTLLRCLRGYTLGRHAAAWADPDERGKEPALAEHGEARRQPYVDHLDELRQLEAELDVVGANVAAKKSDRAALATTIARIAGRLGDIRRAMAGDDGKEAAE
jgi:hypothetical protein